MLHGNRHLAPEIVLLSIKTRNLSGKIFGLDRDRRQEISQRPLFGDAKLFLYLAARAQIVREKILPALEKGKVVISDRFEDSTRAYQGFGRRISLRTIEEASKLVRGTLKPDLTFVLDINTAKGLKRGGRHDRIEREALSFHKRVRQGYLTLARKEPKRIFLIHTNEPVEWVSQKVRERLERVFGQ